MRFLRAVVVGVVTVVVLVVLALFVFPTRAYLAQQEATSQAEERLAVLTERTETLEERAADLDSNEEIERIAREELGMVMPGEEAYVVLPPPLPPIDLPELWLFGDLDAEPIDPATGHPVPEAEPGAEGPEVNDLPTTPAG